VVRVTNTYVRVRRWLEERLQPQDGATAIEYALIVALIAVVIVTAVTLLGTSTSSTFEDPQLVNALG
jgi:pilus assembly protein Flp/PilA